MLDITVAVCIPSHARGLAPLPGPIGIPRHQYVILVHSKEGCKVICCLYDVAL